MLAAQPSLRAKRTQLLSLVGTTQCARAQRQRAKEPDAEWQIRRDKTGEFARVHSLAEWWGSDGECANTDVRPCESPTRPTAFPELLKPTRHIVINERT